MATTNSEDGTQYNVNNTVTIYPENNAAMWYIELDESTSRIVNVDPMLGHLRININDAN